MLIIKTSVVKDICFDFLLVLQNKDNNNIIYMIFRTNRFTLVTPYIHHSKTGRPRRLCC